MRNTVLLVVLAGMAGCADASPAPQWTTSTRTSGDTTIVRTSRVRDSDAAMDVREGLRIGAADNAEEYLFGEVTRIAPGPDGSVYVWDEQANVLRLYDSGGRHVRTIGRPGRGPGEYGGSNGLAAMREYVALWDADNGRVNVYDTSGIFINSWPVPRNVGYIDGGLVFDTTGNLYVRQPLGDGDGYLRVRVEDGAVLDTLRFPQLGPPTPQLRAIGTAPGIRTMRQVPVPFFPGPMIRLSPAGDVVSGTGKAYAVTRFHPDGTLLRIERDVEPVPVAEGERRALEDAITSQMRKLDPAWRWDVARIPQSRPFFIDLVVASDGAVWVRRSLPPEERVGIASNAALPLRAHDQNLPPTYDVFDANGTFRGRVVLPASAKVLAIRNSEVWTTLTDDLGVPYVVRFDVRPREP